MAHALAKLDGAGSRKDTVMFDAHKIVIETNHNPRSKEMLRENISRLKPQILAAGGILQDIWLRKDGDRAILVDGESRLTAFIELLNEGKIESPFVPTKLFNGMASEIDRVLLAITANGGKPLEKWEHGKAFNRLCNLGQMKEEIADKLGLSLRYVTEAMTLADTPEEMRAMLAAGTVTTGAVMAEVKAVGPEQATKNLKKQVEDAGGVPIKRSRTLSNQAIISAAIQLSDEAIVDSESPEWYTVSKDSLIALRNALKELNNGNA